MRFRLTPRSMTLTWYKFKFSQNFAGYLEPTTANRMKIDSYYQRRNCSPLNLLFSGV